jgi:hypothetical protein
MAEADLKKGLINPLPVNLTDDCTRLLGQICYAGSPIDPRAIRALAFLTDSVDVSGSNINVVNTPSVDVTDRVGRLLGIVNSITNPVDISDRAARLVGIVYGNLTQLQQRAVTNELLVQLRNAGVDIDPRDRNWDMNFATDQADVSGSSVTTASGSLVTMEDAFMELRLMADGLKDLPMSINPSNSRLRVDIENSISIPITGTLTAVTNIVNIGGNSAAGYMLDTMDIVFNTGIRPHVI